MKYNWQLPDWKKFTYNIGELEELLVSFSEKTGTLKGITTSINQEQLSTNLIEILVTESMKTAEIEGEFLSRKDVRSSIQKKLGIPTNHIVKDKNSSGMANVVTQVYQTFKKTLTKQTLFDWHTLIFSETSKVNRGNWREHNEPMQIVSGALGKETVHFEAVPSSQVEKEMEEFIDWFNSTAPKGKNKQIHAPIRSAIAHLYFESIHPFEDGNGRIGRAIAEKALMQTVNHPIALSLSAAIESSKKEYYKALKKGQKSNEVTDFISYFTSTILQSIENSIQLIQFTVKKTHLFDTHKDQLNERQTKVLRRMLQESNKKFEGGMSAKKYMRITKTSKATATRDIQQLRELGIFSQQQKGGRSTSYEVNL